MKKLIVCCLLSAAIAGTVGFVIGKRQPPTREAVIAYIGDLDVTELGQVMKTLERKWGLGDGPPKLSR
jgi:hypothetical protein